MSVDNFRFEANLGLPGDHSFRGTSGAFMQAPTSLPMKEKSV